MKKLMLLVILVTHLAGLAQEDFLLEPEPRRSLHKMAGMGNLSGLSIGGNYTPIDRLSLEAMIGFGLPYTPFMPAPYPANQFTAQARLRLIHPIGIYLMGGYFAGSYEIRQNSGDFSVAETTLMHAPLLALGFAWPKPPTDVQALLELGAAYGLPEELSFDKADYLGLYRLEARRSYSRYKQYFPFFTILFQL